MSYFQIKPDKRNRKLIDVSKFDEGTILNFLEEVTLIDPKTISNEIYQKSSDKEFITQEISKLIREDLLSTEKDFNIEDFNFQYFFNSYNPIIKISSFSCELKNKEGGTIVYDIVRVGKSEDEFYLFIPQEDD